MPNTSPTAWTVWVVIVIFLLICIGIIIWFAVDSTIPPRRDLVISI